MKVKNKPLLCIELFVVTASNITYNDIHIYIFFSETFVSKFYMCGYVQWSCCVI